MRICAACRTRRPQGVLLRVARIPDGTIGFDSGKRKLPGRGAYICAALDCLQRAQQRRALQRTLGREIPVGIFEELRERITHC